MGVCWGQDEHPLIKEVCEGEDETGREVDECICTVKCTAYCTGVTPGTHDNELAVIKYCPWTEFQLPKYLHVDYKGGNSRRWPVQYQHCAGRAREVVVIPRVEVEDVSLEKDDMEDLSKKESWTTDLEEVRMIWKSKEEEIEEQKLLPTERSMGDRSVSQEFANLCPKFETWDGGGEE